MRSLGFVLLCLGSAIAAAQATAPIVYFDIAGTNGAAQQSFYADLFGWTATATGEVSVPVISPLPGLIRQEPTGNPMALVELENGVVKIP